MPWGKWTRAKEHFKTKQSSSLQTRNRLGKNVLSLYTVKKRQGGREGGEQTKLQKTTKTRPNKTTGTQHNSADDVSNSNKQPTVVNLSEPLLLPHYIQCQVFLSLFSVNCRLYVQYMTSKRSLTFRSVRLFLLLLLLLLLLLFLLFCTFVPPLKLKNRQKPSWKFENAAFFPV